jgi:hypothetical protein
MRLHLWIAAGVHERQRAGWTTRTIPPTGRNVAALAVRNHPADPAACQVAVLTLLWPEPKAVHSLSDGYRHPPRPPTRRISSAERAGPNIRSAPSDHARGTGRSSGTARSRIRARRPPRTFRSSPARRRTPGTRRLAAAVAPLRAAPDCHRDRTPGKTTPRD